MYPGLHVKCPTFCPFLTKADFLTNFNKSLQYQISLKSFQWEPSWFVDRNGRASRQAWRS